MQCDTSLSTYKSPWLSIPFLQCSQHNTLIYLYNMMSSIANNHYNYSNFYYPLTVPFGFLFLIVQCKKSFCLHWTLSLPYYCPAQRAHLLIHKTPPLFVDHWAHYSHSFFFDPHILGGGINSDWGTLKILWKSLLKTWQPEILATFANILCCLMVGIKLI